MASLVSGNPGSGKSTLTRELRRRGHRAVDADLVPGLAAWMNGAGEVVGDDSVRPTPELLRDCYWGWSGSRLHEVLEALGEDGILLGIAVNQWEFTALFDRLVLLELDAGTQQQRVAARDSLVRRQIADGLPVLQARMLERGAARVDAALPTPAVADAVIALLTRSGPAGMSGTSHGLRTSSGRDVGVI